MKIKELSELNGLKNKMFSIETNKNNSVFVTNNKNNAKIKINYVEDLKLYGFNVSKLRKADLGVLEAIADQHNIRPVLIRGKWYYGEKGDVCSLNSLLREEGYYI